MGRQLFGEFHKRPAAIRRRQDFSIIDPAAATLDVLLLLADQQIEVVVFHFGRRRTWRGTFVFVSALTLPSLAGAQILTVEGIDQDAVQFDLERVVANDDLVAAIILVDSEVEAQDLHVGEGAIDRSFFRFEEELQYSLQVNMPCEGLSLLIPQPRRLLCFRMNAFVVAHFQPGGKCLIELFQRQHVPGTHLALELRLGRFDETLYQTAARRITRFAMQQLDVQGQAGCLERVGVIDLGIVHIEFSGRPMIAPSTQQRIDQHVQVVAIVIA